MTCKDCVHYEVCNKFGDEVLENFDICVDFKDKAKFIELPCKVGDKVYSALYGKVTSHHIRKIEINKDDLFACSALMIPFSEFGKTVFLTKEEAEKALEERENK